MKLRLFTRFAFAPLALALLASPVMASDLDEKLQLNSAITVTGEDVTLGDIFTGYLTRPEKVVAQAPRPGQRLMLSTNFLTSLAHTYGLNWKPAAGTDHAVVYTPGQAVAAKEIMDAVKAHLIAKGMPTNYSLTTATALPTLNVAPGTAVTVAVRDAAFNAQSRSFTAVVEVPPGSPSAQIVSLRGPAVPVIEVPMLKEALAKNTLITAAMLTMVEIPEEQMRAEIITDPRVLIGKAPKGYLRAGITLRTTDVAQVNLIEVPVLAIDSSRESAIAEASVTYATFNAAELPNDVVMDAAQLIGRTPRRLLTAGSPVRRGDVQMIRRVQVAVAARDLGRGDVLGAEDVSWVNMNDNEVVSYALTQEGDIVGRAAKHPIRAGQTLRKFDIDRPIAVERSKLVTVLYSAKMMNLTVQGQAMEAGGIGDVIRVTNTKSRTVVTAEIIDANTVRVVTQTASR